MVIGELVWPMLPPFRAISVTFAPAIFGVKIPTGVPDLGVYRHLGDRVRQLAVVQVALFSKLATCVRSPDS